MWVRCPKCGEEICLRFETKGRGRTSKIAEILGEMPKGRWVATRFNAGAVYEVAKLQGICVTARHVSEGHPRRLAGFKSYVEVHPED